MKILALMVVGLLASTSVYAAEVTVLEKHTTTWDGTPLTYPRGMEQVTAIKMVLQPGEKMPFHCHPVPIVGYVLKGELEVETLGTQKHTFKAGDTISELVKTWHRGVNKSATEPVELIGFYIGVKGTPVTIEYNEKTKSACK